MTGEVEMASGADSGSGAETVPPKGGRPEALAEGRSSVHAVWEMPKPVRTEPVVSVNLLCLIGAMVGVVSLFLPWCMMVEGPNELGVSPADLITDTEELLSSSLTGPALLFTIGAVTAFLFPVSFAVQTAGIVLFLRVVMDQYAGAPLGYDYEMSLGFYAAVLSSVMVLAGLVRPVGPGYDGRWPWWSRRTEVSSRADFAGERLVRQGLAMPMEAVGALKGARSRVYAAAVAMALIAGLLLVGLQMYWSHDPVTSIDEGVKMVVGESATFTRWREAYLTLTDGSATVNWSADSVSWAELPRTEWYDLPMVFFGTQDLSGLALVLAFVDVTEDEIVTPGDMIFLFPSGDSSFAEGVSYRMTIDYNPSHWTYGPELVSWVVQPGTDGVITFEFEGDEVASSSAEGGMGDHDFSDLAWASIWVAGVALGSAHLGVAYYVPVTLVRWWVLRRPSQEAPPSGTPDLG